MRLYRMKHTLMCAFSAAQLADAIAKNKALTTLDLGGNNIGPEGVKALAAVLKGHEALRSLELGYNPLGPAGTKTIVDVAKFDAKVCLFVGG